MVLSYNRPPTVGGLAGTCRSKSSHRLANNPPARGADSIHAEPTSRRTVRSIHPVNVAQGYGVRPGHTARYIIVNEHVPRKKLLHSATRIPRHYLIAEPPEILEPYPHNSECFAPQNIKCQQRSRRPHISHLPQGWEDKEDEGHLKRKRRPQDHCFLPERQSHVYNGNHTKNHKGRHTNPRRYGKAKQDDGEGGTDLLAPKFQTSVTEDDLRLCSVHPPPVRPRPLKSSKVRATAVTPQTESDSASLASSSDQHNSSTDQYIQVIHNRSEGAQKRAQTSFYLNGAESRDLVCSNV